MNEQDAIIYAAQQFPTKKERRQYALLQAAAIIYSGSERWEGAEEQAFLKALELLAKIEGTS